MRTEKSLCVRVPWCRSGGAALLVFASLFLLPVVNAARPVVQSRPASATSPADADEGRFDKWEKEIAAYEVVDRNNPPEKGGVLFIGSSTVRLWKTLAQDFPKHHVLNRGFGGSQIEDSTHFAERIVFPYEPRMIVLRAGGNDIHAGKSPERVFADYKAFVAKVRTRLPRTPIVYISTNPTPSRWAEWEDTRKLNALIEKYVREQPGLKYLETADMVLGADGKPRAELFVQDRLHFSPEGYKLLAERVRTVLPK